MNNEKLYNGLIAMCDKLNKFDNEYFINSNGVFLSMNDGILTIITFSKKYEDNVIKLLNKNLILYPWVIVFIDKYFQFKDIIVNKKNIELQFSCNDISIARADKNFENFVKYISKENDNYILQIEYYDNQDDIYSEISNIITSTSDKLDHLNSKEYQIDIYNDLNKSVTPIDISDGRMYLRLHKSLFGNIVKGDTGNVKCIPYIDEDSSVFLTVTTVNKADLKVMNIFNVLYLDERNE